MLHENHNHDQVQVIDYVITISHVITNHKLCLG